MPDTRTRRGPHPKDAEGFAPPALPALRRAADDLCWLLTRGYPKKASVKLVGDRHGLIQRQRTALQRTAASDEERTRRAATEAAPEELAGRDLLVDGYNVLLTVEAALGGGVVLAARDGTFRDMAAMSGHYRRVNQTVPALERIGAYLAARRCRSVHWLLDRPVSNSGRLKKLIEATAAERGWPWEVELAASPDRALADAGGLIATADSVVLDRCRRWINLARQVVEGHVPEAWIVDLSVSP